MQRRDFFRIAGLSTFAVNGFSMRPFANTHIARALANCDEVADRVLILIQLKGGNDGINTLVPIAQYGDYEELRPVIKIPDVGPEKYIQLDNTLPTADRIGLHPVMTGFKAMYDEGLLSVVQGVGYENINGSHFKGTDLWLSGGDGTPDNFNIRSGWMGRALQAMFPDVLGTPIPDMLYPLGIQVGDPNPSLGFHTETEHQNVINLYGQDPDGFYSLVQTIGGAPLENVPASEYGVEIEYIMGVERSVDQYSEYITQAFQAGTNSPTNYPQTSLAYQLKTIARLIKGGCKTKMYLCSMGGFDTHGRQIPPEGTILEGGHADLLRLLSDACKAFFDDLKGLQLDDKVMACTFSEFGRCARENGGAGTDHGTLAPMFIMGKPAKSGVNGTNVDLANLTDDNQLQGQQFDYRQVFATLLQDWLGGNQFVMEQARFENYQKMPLLDANFVVPPDCYGGAVPTWSAAALPRTLQVSPNPATTRAEVTFRSDVAYAARLTVHTLGGRLAFGANVQVQQGQNLYYLQLGHLPVGTYIVRLEHGMTGRGEVVKLTVVR
jgi:uncharacterized protein (DUF1501 family)